MKVEQASLENSKKHYIMAFSEELHRDADMDFRAGAKFITDRCYDKERIQRLISHIYEATGHTPLESDMHEIIHILTSEQYEND